MSEYFPEDVLQTIFDFNDMLLTLALNIADICPSSLIGTNIKDIKKIIEGVKKDRNNFTKFIDLFCLKVLQYKDQIDSGNEDFFMNKSYDDDLKDQNQSCLSHVLSLKSIWNQLKPENKEIVKTYMQILCQLAQKYFLFVSKELSTMED